MKNIFITSALAMLIAIPASAYAGDSKAEQSATFRLKVAACKAEAKTNGIKSSTPAFYSDMAGCLDRVTVAVNVAPAK